MFFELYKHYGKDSFHILNTEYDTYPIYWKDEFAGERNIVYFDVKIYGSYIFMGFHQDEKDGWFIKYGDDIFDGNDIEEFLNKVKYLIPLRKD